MATSQTCCHQPGEMLNSAAECADRARIHMFHLILIVSLFLEKNVSPRFYLLGIFSYVVTARHMFLCYEMYCYVVYFISVKYGAKYMRFVFQRMFIDILTY
jgi:hypothetical protein